MPGRMTGSGVSATPEHYFDRRPNDWAWKALDFGQFWLVDASEQDPAKRVGMLQPFFGWSTNPATAADQLKSFVQRWFAVVDSFGDFGLDAIRERRRWRGAANPEDLLVRG